MLYKLLLGIVVLAVVGGGAYALSQKQADAPMPEAVEAEPQETTLAALLTLPTPQVCTFTNSTEAAQTAGTVYVAGGKARGDFEATVAGRTYHAHMIAMEETVYSWVDETGIGVKSAVSAGESAGDAGFDATKNLSYTCTSWTPDESRFVLPSGITFADTAGMNGDACAACEMVPEAYRAQCRAAACGE